MMSVSAVTKSVVIERPMADVFRYVNDLANLPERAIHSVGSVKPLRDARWALETPCGPGRFAALGREEFGILDHEFIDAPEGRWRVWCVRARRRLWTQSRSRGHAGGSVRAWSGAAR